MFTILNLSRRGGGQVRTVIALWWFIARQEQISFKYFLLKDEGGHYPTCSWVTGLPWPIKGPIREESFRWLRNAAEPLDVPLTLCQFSSSLCKAPYHSNVKSYTDLGQLNCGVFRPQVHLILITKKTGTSEEQTSGFNHEYQWNLNGGKFSRHFLDWIEWKQTESDTSLLSGYWSFIQRLF